MKKEYWYLLGAFIFVALLVVFAKPIKKAVTRGYQNNNPGNIRITFDKNGNKEFWQGEIDGTDRAFKKFKSMAYGYRAIFILLRTYISMGKNTIAKIISTYAPTNENDTSSYIKTVKYMSGLSDQEVITIADTDKLKKIVAGISYQENGITPDEADIDAGYVLFVKG